MFSLFCRSATRRNTRKRCGAGDICCPAHNPHRPDRPCLSTIYPKKRVEKERPSSSNAATAPTSALLVFPVPPKHLLPHPVRLVCEVHYAGLHTAGPPIAVHANEKFSHINTSPRAPQSTCLLSSPLLLLSLNNSFLSSCCSRIAYSRPPRDPYVIRRRRCFVERRSLRDPPVSKHRSKVTPRGWPGPAFRVLQTRFAVSQTRCFRVAISAETPPTPRPRGRSSAPY